MTETLAELFVLFLAAGAMAALIDLLVRIVRGDFLGK